MVRSKKSKKIKAWLSDIAACGVPVLEAALILMSKRYAFYDPISVLSSGDLKKPIP
jgi:hypothetical protein